MFPWRLVCIAAVAVIFALAVKIAFLYQDLKAIGRQLHERLGEDTNNVIYVSGNDRHLRAFAGQINQELKCLYDKRRKYQNGDRELKEAVTNISHDLRTPLTAIYGYLELLEAEPKPETVEHYLAQIGNRADAMRELTEELFRYSVILSAQVEERREPVALNRALADCLLSYYDIFIQNRITPEVNLPEEEVVRSLDAGALRRVFCNILDNAIKYGRPETEDTCVVADRAPEKSLGKMRVTLFPDGTITFCNRAGNLDKVSVERLFDRFYTVETGRNSTGLGLSIAKLLTERMGGSISAEYEGKELTIRIRFGCA